MAESYQLALVRAAAEAFEGRYSSEELAQMVDYDRLIADALALINEASN